MIKICAYCGKPFETKSGTKKFCDDIHYANCVVCGKKFKLPNAQLNAKDRRKTCSKACTAILRKSTCIDKYGGVAPASSKFVQDKMKATTLERFGVEHAAQNTQVQQKMRNTSKDRYGVDYFTQTEEYKEKAKKTNISKYGAEWAAQSNEVRDKIESTNIEKYGSKNAMQNEQIRDKQRQSYFSKTGYHTPWSNPDVIHKTEETNLSRYGVRRPLQSREIQEKSKTTNQIRYGVDNPMQNESIKLKMKSTTLDRYGSECYLSSDEGRHHLKNAMQSKYGVNYFSQSTDWLSNVMLDESKIANFKNFKSNPKQFILDNYVAKPKLYELANDLGVHENTAGWYINEYQLSDYVDYVYSKMEQEVYDFIKSLDPDIEIIRNTKKVITPYELDLYLPKYNFAIECNPTSTHNSSINTFDRKSKPTDKNYHKMKTDLCESKGIFLFHIFGYEWTNKEDIIKSMIRNILHKNSFVVYGRKTVIKGVDSSTARIFLNSNHRQGYAPAPIRYGLYFENELVSIMTFSKIRHTIGESKNSDGYELVRFCNRLDTSVSGGASKLFKYFLNIHHPDRVISFSDRAHTRGNLYSTLGFRTKHMSDPGYVWVNYSTDTAYHRSNAQKQNIKKFLHDDLIDLSRTEKQIMEEHRFVSMYDSGTILWEYTNSSN